MLSNIALFSVMEWNKTQPGVRFIIFKLTDKNVKFQQCLSSVWNKAAKLRQLV